MPSSEDAERAAQLKAEGNTLFGKKLFDEASEKYTQAIALDDQNAVLYANRAACHLNIKSYGKAAINALRATKLDPAYAKAWARLALAQDGLQDYKKAVASWKRSIALLPNDNPTAAEIKQREEYTASLHRSLRQATTHSAPLRKFGAKGLIFNSIGKRMPAQCAEEMIPRLVKKGIMRSSAFVISEACRDFQSALKSLEMVSVKNMPATPGMPAHHTMIGMPTVLAEMSNAILQDERCVAISDTRFQERMNIQIKMELQRSRSPRDLLEFDSFIAEIRRLHAQGGHEISRPAITTPVRVLICRAYLESSMSRDFAKGIEVYDYILRLLRWGRQEWAGVPTKERGVIFEDTFLNGVRNRRLTAYMEAYSNDKKSGKFTLEGLLQEADSLLEDVRICSLQTPQPGFNLAFGEYIEANALAMKGFYWNHRTRNATYTTAEEVGEGLEQLRTSADLYFEAADKLPIDDENHAWWRKIGLDQLLSAGAPLFITLPILENLWPAVILAQEIWQFSQLRVGEQGKLYDDLEAFEAEMRKMLKDGTINMNAGVSPPWAFPKDIFGEALDLTTVAPTQYI